MTLIETLNLVPPLLFVGFHVAEALFPARRLPRSLGWRLQGLLWFLVSGALFTNLPRLWSGWAAEHKLFDTSALGLWGALLVIVVAGFVGYVWHRLRHAVPFLWRFHQLHHSAERLDVSGAFLFHPMETVAVAFLISVTSTLVLGVSADAAAVAGAFGFFNACFQHANIRTPRWLGYVIQRPESHSVHHARGVHAFNYTDLPIYDILFGTFKNPAEHEPSLGFFDGGSRQLGRMLLALDATHPPAAPPSHQTGEAHS
jgi:sterol desaturase/sphingolipid hydroxylase (fatty acid hydroxylase superfamily)